MQLIETSDLDLACRQPELVESLRLKRIQLESAPEAMGAMVNLTRLELEGDCFKDIGGLIGMLGKLPALRHLRLSLPHCEELPASMGALVHLNYLQLEGPSLHALPMGMEALQELRSVDIFIDSWIGEAPHLKPLGRLPSLKHVWIKGMGSPPRGMEYLKQVTGLFIRSITHVPIGIGGMDSLERLEVECSDPGATEPLDLREIGTLANLEMLKLRVHVPLRFPGSMAGMLRLKKIDMQESQQEVLPEGFADLPVIQSIEAKKNRISELPDWIGRMKSLVYLYLESNRIDRLPDSLTMATSLRYLGLHNNAFTEFPGVVLRSPSLVDVALGENRIGKVEIAEGTGTALRSLSLAGNRLAAFPWSLVELPDLRIAVMGNPFLGSGLQGMGQVIYRITGTPYALGTRRSLCALAIGDIPKALETATLEDLLIALGDDEAKMRSFALEALGRLLPDPFSGIGAVSSIRIAGQSKTYSLPELKKQLEGRGIKVNKGKPGAVEVMVLAEKPGDEVMNYIGAGAKAATVVQLAAYVGKAEEKWLQQQSVVQPKVVEHVGRLLGSGNAESMELALGMMAEGGVPEGLLSAVLAIHLLAPDAKVRKAAGELFIGAASPQLNGYLQVEKRNVLSMSEEKLVKHLESFSSHAEIDKEVFARQAFALNRGLGPYYAPYAKAEDLPNFLDKDGFVSLPTSSKITEIPAALRDAERVEAVSFGSRDWKALPKGIGAIKGLRRLVLHKNKLRALPEEFRQLQSLAYLDLSFNDFATFPEQVCGLAQLEVLEMSRNPVKELPPSFAQLTRLREFRFAEHQLDRFPEVLTALPQLERLDLWSEGWSEFPLGILQLRHLRELVLGGHGFNRLPDGIGGLPLEHLELCSNDLLELPESVVGIRSLRYLGLMLNRNLRVLPAGVGGLEHLEVLRLSGTGIRSLPESFVELKRLRELDITKLEFEEPEAVIELLRQLPALATVRYPFERDKAFKQALKAGLPHVRVI